MPKVEISEETYQRLSKAVEEGDEHHRKHPEYRRGADTVDALAESFCAGGLDRRDEMKRIAALPFRSLHGRS